MVSVAGNCCKLRELAASGMDLVRGGFLGPVKDKWSHVTTLVPPLRVFADWALWHPTHHSWETDFYAPASSAGRVLKF